MATDFDFKAESPDFRPLPVGLLDLGLASTDAGEDASPTVSMEQPGDWIGRYRLIEPLGEGGFGMVWHAQQIEPIRRELALKVIKPGMDSREVIRRFAAERQALALMDHPHIAAVLDAGTTSSGRPYFVMELVNGEPITAYCDRRQLPVRERLELFRLVCQAVQHAHQKAILHRDLKPSNILVAEIDGQPVPKVIDFGIAKALEAEGDAALAGRSMQTEAGIVIGTPQYMSPEQAGSVPDVDTRSDLYALGVILYELLTGETPIAVERLRQAPWADVLLQIREEDAVLPSVRVLAGPASVGISRRSEARRLSREYRGDLDWIVTKALEKDRRRRYDSAALLARDLECFLASEPVSAVAPTWRYRFSKFARRNRGTLVAASLIGVALVAGMVMSLWQAARAERSRAEADANFDRARQAVMDYLIQVTGHPRFAEAEFGDLQLDLLQKAMPFYDDAFRQRAADPRVRADHAWALGALSDAYERVGRSDEAAKASRQAMAIEERLVEEFPNDPERWQRFIIRGAREAGIAAKSDRVQALALLDRAIHFSEKIRAANPQAANYRYEYSSMLASRSNVLRSMGRNQESLAGYEKALANQEALVAEYPKETAHRDLQARLLGEIARCLNDQGGDPTRAEKAYLRTIELQDQTVKELPTNPEFRVGLLTALRDYSQWLVGQKKYEEALGHARRAVDEGGRLQKEFPKSPRYQGQFAVSVTVLAEVYRKLDRRAEAEEQYQRSLTILGGMARDFPKMAIVMREYGRVLMAVATWRKEEQRWPDAAKYYEQVVQVCDRNRADNPGEYIESRQRAEACQGWFESAVAVSDHACVARAARALPGAEPKAWEGYQRAAAWLLKSAELVGPPSDEPARQQAMESYFQQSVECLQQAVLNGYPDLASDGRKLPFSMLAARADFRALSLLKITVGSGEDRSPKRFSYIYKYSDPGPRIWTKEGQKWTETQPSGKKNVYQITRRIVVNGAVGTEIARVGMEFFVFIPDRDSTPPLQIKMKGKDGWTFLGAMEGVE